MPGDGSAAITAGSPSVGLANFATQFFRQFTKESLEVNLQTKTITLLSATAYLLELELDIVEVDRQYHRTVEKRQALAGDVHALEHQEHLLVAKRARLSERAKEIVENVGWLECKVKQMCAVHNRAPLDLSRYEN